MKRLIWNWLMDVKLRNNQGRLHLSSSSIKGREKVRKTATEDGLSCYELVNPSRELDKRDNFAYNGVYIK